MILMTAMVTAGTPVVFVSVAEDLGDVTATAVLLRASEIWRTRDSRRRR
ncbi:hypothetical protein TIFTF001_008997 [Ficus carica]|uniref:Uncharacterized protein n=1 Tax=Ficus carica TaxID=3494 RepID=A0AA87ZTY9_FICCA|nr:hypothetical protein TIFTF001_008997 [Ficus carica]